MKLMKIPAILARADKLKSNPIFWILAGSLALRIYSAATRYIINPDGALYLYQASAIFNHRWSELLGCGLNYVTPLPFLVAFVFNITGDWITAGQIVNVLFGWATLIPLYYLLRRFADRTVSALTLLVFALIPVFVKDSSDMLRGPIFWFCLCAGMLMFVRQWDADAQTGRYRVDLLVSGLFLLVATWTRIEGVVFLAATPLYLAMSKNEHKAQRILFFLLPLALLTVAAVGAAFCSETFSGVLRFRDVLHETTSFASRYKDLDAQIRAASHRPGMYADFLSRVKEILGFVPLVVLFNNFLEGIFYPFALVYFVGFVGLGKRFRKDRRIGYFLLLSLVSFAALYIHIIDAWIFTARFLAIFIYPGFIIMANGIEVAIAYFKKKEAWQLKSIVQAGALLIVILGVSVNLNPIEKDKVVYRQAAQTLAQHGYPDVPRSITAVQASRGFRWVVLYASRNKPVLPCARSLVESVPANYSRFVSELDKAHIRYFFYEKRYWPRNGFDFLSAPYSKDFHLLGKWRHPDSTELMLFQRNS